MAAAAAESLARNLARRPCKSPTSYRYIWATKLACQTVARPARQAERKRARSSPERTLIGFHRHNGSALFYLCLLVALASSTSLAAAGLIAVDPPRAVQVYPGLLDGSLLGRGSFAFDTRQVQFDKLRVLGNVYVGRINGRPLRESYLLKSNVKKRTETRASDDELPNSTDVQRFDLQRRDLLWPVQSSRGQVEQEIRLEII